MKIRNGPPPEEDEILEFHPVYSYLVISNKGRVFRTSKRDRDSLFQLKVQYSDKEPRKCRVETATYGKTKLFHVPKLVAETFLKKPAGRKGLKVIRICDDRFNNRADNLKWGNHSEAVKRGIAKSPRGRKKVRVTF